ncbi:melanoma-associated antigen B3-like [Cavia porcellus]|uniref:melanoma-associated antigen B3-like n=1 Tax=Cavia porcellus TaxID=10141 RepID=UPI002FE3856F
MPQGHKSKLRAQEKHRQTRSETQHLQGAQAPGAQEGEHLSCSPGSGDDAASSPASGLPQKLQAAPPTTSAPGVATHKRSGAAPIGGLGDPGYVCPDEDHPTSALPLSTASLHSGLLGDRLSAVQGEFLRCLDHQLSFTFIMPPKQRRKTYAPKKLCPVEEENQEIEEAQATTTEKILHSSSPPPLEDITHADSLSQLQSPPEELQIEGSTAKATDTPNLGSEKGAKLKTKNKKMSVASMASNLVNHIIEMYNMKKPIMKKDMLKIIGKKYKKHFPQLLVKASFNIEAVFGMELKEVDDKQNSYSLVSKMNLPYNGVLSRGKGFPKTGLLMHILGVIFMKGNSATEESIWEFLNKMKIYDGKKHFLFGEPRKLITKDLVKLKYLEYRQVPDSDPPQWEFLWGPRAYAETSKMKVLEYWAKINDTDPSTFQSKYEEAVGDEKENTEAVATGSDSTNVTERVCSSPGITILPTIIEVDEEEDSSYPEVCN